MDKKVTGWLLGLKQAVGFPRTGDFDEGVETRDILLLIQRTRDSQANPPCSPGGSQTLTIHPHPPKLGELRLKPCVSVPWALLIELIRFVPTK